MLAAALVIVGVVILLIIAKCIASRRRSLRRVYAKVHDKVFYNMFIRYILNSSLKLQFASVLTLMLLEDFESTQNLGQGIASTLLLTILAIFPFVFAVILWKNYKHLSDEAVRKKFGSLYIGAYLDNKVYPLTYSIIFLIRRSLFSLLTALAFEYPSLQVQLLIFSTILYIIYLNFLQIYEVPHDLWLENFNEVFFILTLYHLVLFSDLIFDP